MPPSLTNDQAQVSARIALKLTLLGLTTKFIEPVIEGPVVSVYRFQPQGSTRVAQIENLSQDFAVALGVEDVLVKRMPGEEAVGVFVPNKERKLVQWRDLLGELSVNKGNRYEIPLILGVDHLGHVVVEDLALFPHLLIAGSTGGGKSTLERALFASWTYSCPNVHVVVSDTKGVEFGHFIGAPGLLFPPATNVYQTLEKMDWLLQEMERRLKIFAKGGFLNINEYNQDSRNAKTRLSRIVFLIDELADLLGSRSRTNEERSASVGKIASQKLSELASKARASGIHVIAGTQRPSVKLLEGDIKSNFTARLSFRLPSYADSTTVLSTGGAEHLLARGDMLFVNPNKPGLQRIHAPIASLEDIKAAVEFAERRAGA